jgi:glycosyltransferase involved in cell wall biosynthesis
MVQSRPTLSVVLPAYNEGHHLHANLCRIARGLGAAGRTGFELIVVDDGSSDNTAGEAERAGEDGLPVQVLRQPINRGKGAALLAGAGLARGEIVAFLDADLEIGPEALVQLVATMEASGADAIVGARGGARAADGRTVDGSPGGWNLGGKPDGPMPGGQAFPLPRRLMSLAYRLLVRALFDLPMETQTGIKLFRRPVLDACLPRLRAERFAFDVEILTACQRLGYRIVACPVSVDYGREGRLGRVTPRQVAGMLGETLAIYYRASFWRWLEPGPATRLWIVVLGAGIFLFGIGVGKLLTPLVLAAPIRPIFYIVALQFLPRNLRDGLLVVGGAMLSVVAIMMLNKRILAAFARRDGGDLAGIWRWAPPPAAPTTAFFGEDEADVVAVGPGEVAVRESVESGGSG